MSDTTHPELSTPAGIPLGSEPPAVPNAEPPPSTDGQSDFGELPPDILDAWRWIYKGREEGLFDQYAGKHIAFFDRKVWGSSFDPELLREYVALKAPLDPGRLVIAYIDSW
jgi:hypothetical protein